MSLHQNTLAFSSDGEYLAYSSSDGCLKIWETAVSVLKQEYVPSSHLSATCSSLSWGPRKKNKNAAKKAKQSGKFAEIPNLQLISIGTMTGDILLYSFTSADLYSCLTNGHVSAVKSVCWCESTNALFSCSSDQHVIVWDVVTGQIKTKWKADKSAINSLAVIDNNNILTASSSIKWWNVTEKTVVKTFLGHATEVFKLLIISSGSASYFLSAAIGDRVLNVWQLDDSKKKNATASFVLSGEPVHIDYYTNEPFKLAAVTKEGLCQIFEHSSNGKNKTALHPKFSVQIASKASKPFPVPVLASFIKDGLESCLISYGSFLKPMFERINIADLSSDFYLIRDFSFAFAVSVESSISKIKRTERPNNVKMLAPGHMVQTSASKKRKKKNMDIGELPMEERLKALDLSQISQEEQKEDEFLVPF